MGKKRYICTIYTGNMEKDVIKYADLELVKNKVADGFIEDDIIVSDKMGELPIPDEPRRLNFILVALCKRGKAQFCVDTQERMVQANDVLIVTDRHVVDNYMASRDLEGLGMIITPNFFAEIVRNVSEISTLMLFAKDHPVVSLSSEEGSVFEEYFYLIRKKVAEMNHHFRKELIKSLLLSMFYDLSNVIYRVQQLSNSGRKTRTDTIFTEFIRLLEANYKHERRVSWYAEQQFITSKYLSESVKQASKLTPNEWIDNYVTLEIRVMLKNTTKSIKEISEELNFPNQSFLGKYFKEHVGMSPSEYRKK